MALAGLQGLALLLVPLGGLGRLRQARRHGLREGGRFGGLHEGREQADKVAEGEAAARVVPFQPVGGHEGGPDARGVLGPVEGGRTRIMGAVARYVDAVGLPRERGHHALGIAPGGVARGGRVGEQHVGEPEGLLLGLDGLVGEQLDDEQGAPGAVAHPDARAVPLVGGDGLGLPGNFVFVLAARRRGQARSAHGSPPGGSAQPSRPSARCGS